jgi:hypothetical protein
VAISFGSEGNYTTYDGVYPAALNYNGATLTIQFDHSVSHQSPISKEPGTYGYEPNMTRDRVHMYVVVDLINKLKAITDPSGSAVLDNTNFHPIAQTVKPYGKTTGRMAGSTVIPL